MRFQAQKTATALALLLASLALTTPAFAGWPQWLCLKPLVPPISAEVKADWVRVFGSSSGGAGSLPGSPRLNNSNLDEHFWIAYRSVPETVLAALRTLPTNPDQVYRAANLLAEAHGANSFNSFLYTIVRRYQDSLSRPHPPRSFSDWEAQGLDWLHRFERSSPEKAAQARTDLQQIKRHEDAENFWRSFGQVTLPIITEGRQSWLVVGSARYRCTPRGNFLEVEFPREHVLIRADNPVSGKKIVEQAAAGIGRPSYYQADIGPDGKAYLGDFNHRFQRENGALVKIRISNPPTTFGLAILMNFLNFTQPEVEEIIRLQDGVITLRELLEGERYRNSLRLYPRLSLLGGQ